MPVRSVLIAAVLAGALATSPAVAEDTPKPKFGPEATPIFADNAYLRQSPAPDYWNLSPFYIPQRTSSDCSLAAIAMAVNALRGLPKNADQELVNENNLMAAVNDQGWMVKVTEDGPGVTFTDTEKYLREALDHFDMASAKLQAVSTTKADAATLDDFRKVLAANETTADNVMLVYFNQGVVTGDWNGPHISAVGAYDAAKDRVLIMDVDRTWYVPYWTSTKTLLDALVKPSPPDQGVLAGGTGGYLLASKL
jgi:hypothetical protein